jgi:hypothetical protein
MYASKSRMNESISIKFGTHIMILNATPNVYFVISYNH